MRPIWFQPTPPATLQTTFPLLHSHWLAAFLHLGYPKSFQAPGPLHMSFPLPITFLHPGFHSWFLFKLQSSSQGSQLQIVTLPHPKLFNIHWIKWINPLHFLSNFQAILTNCNYLVHFLVSLLPCILPQKHLCGQIPLLLHYYTLGPSTVLGTQHGHHQFLWKESVNGYLQASGPRLLNVLMVEDDGCSSSSDILWCHRLCTRKMSIHSGLLGIPWVTQGIITILVPLWP